MEPPLIVQAEYPFKGDNNDELCFKKGDLITVTQREDGGWWEGTLNEKTGWFPSNYVVEYKAPLPLTDTIRLPEEIQEYRSVVLKDLLDSEKAHVAEIQGLFENFLEPLEKTQILTKDEYAQLMGNFEQVVKTHEELLKQMEECTNDRIGKLFLNKAQLMKQVHQSYCAAHPKAVVILDKHKDELEKYMESQGAASSGLLVLTTGLSKPFRRLDKYSAMLQELERHMESSHPDRGDTQRSVAVYKSIASTCSATRRQKELELQVLTGPVRGWQGQELSSLGEIIHMGSVAVGPDYRDRYFVLFPQTLLILSVSQRMSAFIYEGKLPLTGLMVSRLPDTENYKNAFEISSPLIESIIAVCQGPSEANKWVELLTTTYHSLPFGLKRQLSNLSNTSQSANCHTTQLLNNASPPTSQRMNTQQLVTTTSNTVVNTITTGAMSLPSQHKRSLSFNHHLSYNQYTNAQHPPPHHPVPHHQQPQLSQPNHPVGHLSRKSNLIPTLSNTSKTTTPPNPLQQQNILTNVKDSNTKVNWSIRNLRPAAPLRPKMINSMTGNSNGSNNNPSNTLNSYINGRKNQPTFEEDALVLRVFEAYCAAYQNNARNTLHSGGVLQPWTPCLPIRNGKLKSSKTFSTSNPQLPLVSNTLSGISIPNATGIGQQQKSISNLNSSYIWREANPNNFNLYSSSISSLSMSGLRCSSIACSAANGSFYKNSSFAGLDYRALSEEKATRKSLNRLKSGFGSGYDNIFSTPLLPRKHKNQIKKQSYKTEQIGQQQENQAKNQVSTGGKGLYDRRLNRSFESGTNFQRYAGYGGGYILGLGLDPKSSSSVQRSTPDLSAESTPIIEPNDCYYRKSNRKLLLNNTTNPTTKSALIQSLRNVDGDTRKPCDNFCCGNFVMKHWRKHNY